MSLYELLVLILKVLEITTTALLVCLRVLQLSGKV